MNNQMEVAKVMNRLPIKILVMDDELFIREIMGEVLSFHGFDAKLVENADQVFELLNQEHFDLCILDVSVPNGFGALEILKKMRYEGFLHKVILSTGYSDIDLVKNFQNYGFSGLITKPFDVDEMKIIIERVFSNL